MKNSFISKKTIISRNFQSYISRIDFHVPLVNNLFMENEQFERSMVEVLIALIVSRGLKHDPVANAAWPYKKAPGRTWQAIRSDNKSQRLTIRDAYAMARVLGVTMSQLCALVESKELGATFPVPATKSSRPAQKGSSVLHKPEALVADHG